MSEAWVCVVSTKTIHLSERKERSRWELTAWDLPILSVHYMQKGLVFPKPPEPLDLIIQRLETSLSHCLSCFYPLSGRLATDLETTTFVDCNDAGAEFVIAKAAGVYVSDLVNDKVVPLNIVRSFFPLDGNINYDGYSLPLLSVQVTELADGVVIGCSLNHVIGDGESLWHFINSWSELSVGKQTVSRPPLLGRPQIHKELGRIKFIVSEEEMDRFEPAPFSERIFRFTTQAVARIKTKANQQHKPEKGEISSLQALIALMWRCMTRARNLPVDDTVECLLAAGDRKRLNPPLPRDYFGNCLQFIRAEAKVSDLLGQDLGWVARLIHETVTGHTSQLAREALESWVKNPSLFRLSSIKSTSTRVGSSPRFEMYASNFGWGKPLAVLGGRALKYDGKIHAYPGCGGDGAIDLAVCLLPHFMISLESDEELLDAFAPM